MTNEEKILAALVDMQGQMGQMQTQIGQLQGQMDEMKNEIKGINVRLDTEVTQKFNLLAEGQSIIREQLAEVKEIAEDAKATVDVIAAVTAKHTRDIKKLQNKAV